MLELRNDIQVSSTVYEFDIYLLRTGAIPFEYASGQYGILVNPLVKNGGVLTASIVTGSSDPVLVTSHQIPPTISFYDPTNVIRISACPPPGAGKGALISNVSPGTRICRVRLTNTADFEMFRANLTWTTTIIFPTQVYAYVEGDNTKITNEINHTTSNLTNPILNEVTSTHDYKQEDFMMHVYPNPFKDKLVINYNLVTKSQVTLSIFDTNGKLVDELVNEEQHSGNYTRLWNSVLQPEGIYIVKLQADMTQKIFRIIHIQ